MKNWRFTVLVDNLLRRSRNLCIGHIFKQGLAVHYSGGFNRREKCGNRPRLDYLWQVVNEFRCRSYVELIGLAQVQDH